MPTINIEMWSGRTIDQKRKLVRLVTDAVVEALGVDAQHVRIRLWEVEKRHTAEGGVLRSDRDALHTE